LLKSTRFGIQFLAVIASINLFAFDPLSVENSKSFDQCQKPNLQQALSPEDAINYAICNNPSIRSSVATALSSEAQIGSAKSSYLPTISASASRTSSSSNTDGFKNNQAGNSLGLSASYLLYDFGNRESSIDYARDQFLALSASKDTVIQSIFFQTAQAYYNALASKATLVAAIQNEEYSKQSFEAAAKKYEVGVATPSDKLQAKTAYSSAILARIKAEGDEKTSIALLANLIGVDANTKITLVKQNEDQKVDNFSKDVDELIKRAKNERPEIKNASATEDLAKETLFQAKTQYTPTISLSASTGYSDYQADPWVKSSQIGVAINIPLFSGFSTLYAIKSAKEKLTSAKAQKEQEELQVSYDVVSAYQTLLTQTESLKASADLLTSADESYKMALGKYKAGVGGILDLLNAQNALADAKKQKISAFYSWQIAKVSLAKSIGELSSKEIAKR
jgi:TolC family type I secretion outer membrane protein